MRWQIRFFKSYRLIQSDFRTGTSFCNYLNLGNICSELHLGWRFKKIGLASYMHNIQYTCFNADARSRWRTIILQKVTLDRLLLLLFLLWHYLARLMMQPRAPRLRPPQGQSTRMTTRVFWSFWFCCWMTVAWLPSYNSAFSKAPWSESKSL